MDENAALIARKRAIDFHNHGYAVIGEDKQTAYRSLCSAASVDPTMAAAWYMLGNATADMVMYPAAIAAFRRCLELDDAAGSGSMSPEIRAKALVQLSHRLLNNGQLDESLAASKAAIAFLERHPELDQEGRSFAWTNMSQVLSILGEHEAAIDYARKAFAMDPGKADVQTGLGFVLMFAGQYAEGLRHFEARFPYKLPQYLRFPYPRWAGDAVGTLYVAADQGMGDTVSFTRFVPWAATIAQRVIYQVQPELVRMLTTALRHWGNIEVIPQSPNFPAADAWCPVFSLPVTMNLDSDAIRHFPQRWNVPKEAGVSPKDWKAPHRKLHVGIAYAGSPQNDIDRWRSIPVAQFLELYRVPGIQLYSVQVGPNVQDLHAAGCAALIRDMSPWIRDASDTASILRELDLVISIESFVAHLAGAMGKECWIPLSFLGGDWRCGRSGDQPLWYPKTNLFRRGQSEHTWGPTFDRMVAALVQKAEGPFDAARD